MLSRTGTGLMRVNIIVQMKTSFQRVILALFLSVPFAKADDTAPVEVVNEDAIRPPQIEVRVRPDRPDRPNRERTAAMKEALTHFKQKRVEFIAQQRDLTRQLKGASEDDKAAIREKIRQNRASFVETKEEFHDELKASSEKLKEMGRKLQEERAGSSKRE